jgi:two-component system nitrate/nitrite sensor histidine kinase NarX
MVRGVLSKPAWRKILLWGVVVFVFLLFLLYEFSLRSWLVNLPRGFWITLDSVVIILISALAIALILRTLNWRAERSELEQKLASAKQEIEKAVQRQQAVFQISQLYNQANDEEEIIQLTLRFSLEASGASGASYVPLDEHTHPLKPIVIGDMPDSVTEDWLQYLASPAVRQRCSTCRNLGHVTPTCSLLEAPMIGPAGMYCLPITRGGQEYGILNLYLRQTQQLSEEMEEYLTKIMSEASLALEGIRLRNRELVTLRELQTVRERTDLDSLLINLLNNLNDTLEADYSELNLKPNVLSQNASSLKAGNLSENANSLVEGILQTVMTSRQPVIFGDVSGDLRSSPGIRALMAVPLSLPDDSVMGALAVASGRQKAFNQRQLSMLQTISNQAALVVQNINQIAALEYKTMMEERTRLAREIHDGLAQTLGFLKLKMAQMKSFAQQGDYQRLNDILPVCHDTLADAYQEVRQAIDGLRITSDGSGLEGWLRQTVVEIQENSGLVIQICDPIEDIDLPPEVHAQLIRILQEALNNVRKHSLASQAWVSCYESDGDLVLEVRDDGIGYDIDDIPKSSRHGLRGMRERAELIGADFQIISLPMEGTTVRLRLPLAVVGENL